MGLADKFNINPDLVPNVKLGVHIVQAVFAFVIFVLEIVLFRSADASIVGDNGWTFGMCFLTIPALLYLSLTPRFERTRRAAQPHAMVLVDVVWTILWLSAFASQASYNGKNLCGQGCAVSKGIVAIAFFETFFWAITTAISVYTLRYYQSEGILPGYDKIGTGHGQNIDPDKAAFSMAPHDEEAYAPVDMHDRHDDDERVHNDNPYNPDSFGAVDSRPMFDSETSYRPHSTSPAPQDNPFDNSYRVNNHSPLHDPYSESYGSSYGAQSSNPTYAPPSAEDYDHTGPAHFPSANYDRTLH